MSETPAVTELAAAIRDALKPPAAATSDGVRARTRLVDDRAAYIAGAVTALAIDPDVDDLDEDVRGTARAVRQASQQCPVTYTTRDDLAAWQAMTGRKVRVQLKGLGDMVAVIGILAEVTPTWLWVGGEDGQCVQLGDVAGVEPADGDALERAPLIVAAPTEQDGGEGRD